MIVSLGRLQPSDVPEAAALHLEAFPTFFLSSLGLPFLREFYRGFLSDPTAVTVSARGESGNLVGCVVGTTTPDGFFKRLLRRRLLGFVLASTRVAIAKPSIAPRLLGAVRYRGVDVPGASGALLSSICVDPRTQGAGIGAQLISAWEAEAARKGARAAHLTTDAEDNASVNAFYEQQGWTNTTTFTTAQSRRMNLYTKEFSS